jgi:hypothetical protein
MAQCTTTLDGAQRVFAVPGSASVSPLDRRDAPSELEWLRRRGAKHAHLDTFSFQAPGFYHKHGYRVFGELPDFPPGHRRYYLTKDL